MEIVFANGYKAELIKNARDKSSIIRLYSPKDIFLCSLKSNGDNFSTVAEALMNGYFAGWQNCHAAIKSTVLEAMEVEIDEPWKQN